MAVLVKVDVNVQLRKQPQEGIHPPLSSAILFTIMPKEIELSNFARGENFGKGFGTSTSAR